MVTKKDARAYVIVFIVVVGGAALLWGPEMMRYRQEDQIRENGIEAKATVLNIIDTGSRSNHDPVCRVILSVEPPGEAAFRSETEMVLSPVDLTTFKKGSVIRVKFDPKDRSMVVAVH